MPMTKRQLEQVEEDYAGFLPTGAMVIAVRQQPNRTALDQCDICDAQLYSADKEIVVDVGPRARVRRLRMLVCRNGIACRRRAEKQRINTFVRNTHYVEAGTGYARQPIPDGRSWDVVAGSSHDRAARNGDTVAIPPLQYSA